MTLLEIEKERKKIVSGETSRKLISALMAAGISFIVVGIGILEFFRVEKMDFISMIISLIIFGGIFFVTYKNISEKSRKSVSLRFVDLFKDYYVVPFFKERGYEYQKYVHLNAVDIIRSGLFKPFSHQSGNDCVRGVKDGVLFSFSDIVLKDIEKSEHGSYFYSKRIYNYFRHDDEKIVDVKDIFTGLLFMADFNKTITSRTFVMEKGSPKDTKGLRKITMDNAQFNEKFQVFSDDIQNAMYLLSPSLMDAIIKISNHFKAPINISFIKNKIYIAIETGKDNFEPDFNKSVVRQDSANAILRDLEAVLGLIKTLKLNSRIWAKTS